MADITSLAAPQSDVRPVHGTRNLVVAYITSIYPYGNAEQFIEPELTTLTELGASVFVIAARPGPLQIATPRNVGVIRLGLARWQTFAYAAKAIVESPGACLRALIKIIRYSGNIKNLVKNVILFPTGLAVGYHARRLEIRHLHAYWMTGAATVAYIASTIACVPWSASAHSHDIFMENNMVVEKARAANFIRAISKLAQGQLLSRVETESAQKIYVVHVGVSLPQADSRSPGLMPLGRVHILCAANLERVKGHVFLLKAVRLLLEAGEKVHCTLAGDGPIRDLIGAAIQDLDLTRYVSMPGIIPHAELLERLSDGTYDVMVLPSITRKNEFEGIPVSLVEALAAGVPCIATRTGALPELIDGECGLLVPERSAEAIADAIRSLIKDPALRIRLTRNGRKRVLEAFDTFETSSQMLSLMFPDSKPT